MNGRCNAALDPTGGGPIFVAMTIQMLGGGAGPDNRDPVKGGKSAPGGGVAPPPGTDAVPAKHTGGGSSGRGEVPDEAEPAPGGVTDVGE